MKVYATKKHVMLAGEGGARRRSLEQLAETLAEAGCVTMLLRDGPSHRTASLWIEISPPTEENGEDKVHEEPCLEHEVPS